MAMSLLSRVMRSITIGGLVFAWAVYLGHPIETSFMFAGFGGTASIALSMLRRRGRDEDGHEVRRWNPF